MFPLTGLGNEVWGEWIAAMLAQDPEFEPPDGELGEYSNDEIRQPFNDWVLTASSKHVQVTIARLRSIPSHLRRIGVLDDVRQSGNVTLGVVPALYRAAYGDAFQYDPQNNRYLFTSSDWIAQIIRATFGDDVNLRQTKFLVEIAKGDTDWTGFARFDPADIHSLDQLAHYCAYEYVGYSKIDAPPETVYSLIQRYELGLFSLHNKIRSAIRSHTQEVLAEL